MTTCFIDPPNYLIKVMQNHLTVVFRINDEKM